MRIVDVACPELFVGPAEDPDQVVRVTVAGPPGPVSVAVEVARAPGRPPVAAALGDDPLAVEVPVALPPGTPVGTTVPATVTVTSADATASRDVLIPAAEPGWTLHMVSHFHYDPVWWTTQAAYTSAWDDLPGAAANRQAFQLAGFDLVRAHLATAAADPDYTFVLAETDYLKPWWDTVPAGREQLRALIAAGRCELVGGTYNEPNTNLTSVESTIRNLAYGIGLQRDVLGGDPRTAWQLDAFGHDPQFPGLCAGAGLTGSSWARGPFHQWGPLADPARNARVMQFPSEFEWIAPSGEGLLTHYMPAHYSAGWWMDAAATLEDASRAAYDLFVALKPVAATRNVLLPVGTDYSPPNKWVTAIARDWAARYTWPRFVCAVPRDFFAAVRSELDSPVPVSRDMNPVYTGKDVSYIDTKQAQRQAEVRLHAGETFAALASLRGAPYPASTVDGAWRRLLYGAHHDAVTGTEGDQVYLDLLAGWRSAWSAAGSVRDSALAALLSSVDTTGPGTPVTVVNALAWPRTDVVRVAAPAGSSVVDGSGAPVPAVAADGTLEFVARDVPATGWRTYHLVPGAPARWTPVAGTAIRNERYALSVDPARGGTVASLTDGSRELLPAGRVGNEILLYAEYPQHPTFGEGPWHLLPTGPPRAGSSSSPASVTAYTSAAGSRLVVRGRVSDVRFEQVLTVWNGLSRVDCVTRLDPVGADRLLRLRWPTSVHGGLPVSEVGAAVVGRGWGIVDVDSAEHPWTLDNPAHSWFGVSSTARVRLGASAISLGVAEVVAPPSLVSSPAVRALVVALVRAGVTSTTSVDDGSRYGALDIDSNLPDTRILVGGPDRNSVTAAVLESAPEHAEALRRQLAESGTALVYVPASRPLAEVWVPGADLRDVRALPALIVAGDRALAAVAEDLADAEIAVPPVGDPGPGWDGTSVALLSRGLPGFAVDSTGAMHLSLVRACTGWPSGVWIDKPRRTTPDGSGFQLQHWTHTFEYALASGAGDWRTAAFVPAGQGFTAPLHAVLGSPPSSGTAPPAASPPSAASLAGAPSGAAAAPAAAGAVAPDLRGVLPETCSLLSVDPPGAAVVTAVKPAGTPLASGRTPAPGPLAVHLYEAAGRATTVTLRLAGGVSAASRADLLDAPLDPLDVAPDGSVAVPLGPAEVTSVLVHPPSTVDVPLQPPAPEVVSARYWLENSGPAPDGNLPVTVHATPTRGTGPTDLTVTAASCLTEDSWTGVVTVDAGRGWTVDPPEWPLTLPPGGWAEIPVRVTPARTAAPGDHPVTVSLTHDGRTVRDLVVVTVQGPVGAEPGALEVELDTLAVSVRRGTTDRVRATVVNRYRGEIDATLQLLGPADTWPLTPDWTVPLRLAADERRTVTLPLHVPPDTPPGSWWLLARLTGANQVAYSDSIRLTVDR